jgi:probable addiction module antidote protein
MGKARSYKEHLDKRLKDPEEAAAYLTAALEDEDPGIFLVALRDVARAHGGMSQIAKEAHVNRETLYRTLSKKGNPTLNNLRALLGAVGLNMTINPTHC